MKIAFIRFSLVFGLIALLVCAANLTVRAQNTRGGLPDVYAIVDARIVTVSGATIERGTIVIRDGLIQAVGANAVVPPDARTIDGKGLTVYPGIFDANTNLGIAAAQNQTANQPRQFPPQPAAPANQSQSNSVYPQGLQPEVAAADVIRPTDAAFETARNNGFTTALSVPRERIFVGQSALIDLAGDNAAAVIVRAPIAQHIVFLPLQTGQFPTSLMGAFAAVRQMMLDAQRLQTAQKLYAQNSRGQRRPEQNRSLEALFPILNGTMPVVIEANSERQIVRALDLAKEFNFKLMIAGGAEAAKVADRLKAQNVPVLLSLNFPKRSTTTSPEADPETLETLRLRAETPKNAARLQQAGIKFAFQSGGLTNLNDFWANANRAVENGLPRDAAIRAMTLNAAEIFGVATQTGSIEAGKIANLTVTRGDVFDKQRTFTHVFVDGRMFEIKQPPAAAKTTDGKPAPTNQPNAPVNIAGNWNLNIEIPGQATQATANFTQTENRVGGTLQSPFGNSEVQNGQITGDTVTFKIVASIGGQTFDVAFSGKVAGNQMSGTATSPQGAIPFSATKTP